MFCHSFILPICLSSFAVLVVLAHTVFSKLLHNHRLHISAWVSAISQVVINQHDIVQDKVSTIGAEVAVIVGEIEDRKIKWRFSEMVAKKFATKLNKCAMDNLM